MRYHCPECHEKVRCPEHGHLFLHYNHIGLDDGIYADAMVYCGRCVVKYQTALGAVIHTCFNVSEALGELTPEDVETAIAAVNP